MTRRDVHERWFVASGCLWYVNRRTGEIKHAEHDGRIGQAALALARQRLIVQLCNLARQGGALPTFADVERAIALERAAWAKYAPAEYFTVNEAIVLRQWHETQIVVFRYLERFERGSAAYNHEWGRCERAGWVLMG